MNSIKSALAVSLFAVSLLCVSGRATEVRAPSSPDTRKDRALPTATAAGGWTGSGIVGTYYAKTDFTGASFQRTDVRIDFPRTTVAPGGSPDPAFSAVKGGSFSVRWAGTLIPRFTEQYTLRIAGDDTLTLTIDGKKVATGTAASGWVSAGCDFVAGKKYAVTVTLTQGQGPWQAQVHWLSGGPHPFAEQAIEPATPIGVNFDGDIWGGVGGYLANAAQGTTVGKLVQASYNNGKPTWNWNTIANQDIYGPTQDFAVGGQPWSPDGTYSITFNGEARIDSGGVVFTDPTTGQTQTNTAPYGFGYNSSAHTTTLTFPLKRNGMGNWAMVFTNTHRPDGSPGVTNLAIMLPNALGSATSYAPGALFTRYCRSMAQPFTALRINAWVWVYGSEVNWSDRALPYLNWSDQKWADGKNRCAPWESVIALANETGKDLYIDIPAMATDDYVTKLANLLKYGSDRSGNPYTSPQTNPYYAPLNSNLRLYVEYANEVWNFGSAVYGMVCGQIDKAKKANNADYRLFTAMGARGHDVNTWALLRDYQISNLFRAVFGDAAMPANDQNVVNPDPIIRPLCEWQNDGSGGVTGQPFVQGLYHLSQHVAHPVNYYIWGGGGDMYASVDTSKYSNADQAFASVPLTAVPSVTKNVKASVCVCLNFGLHEVAYEGGFNWGGNPNAVSMAANLDSRTTPYAVQTLRQFFAAGGYMPVLTNNWSNPGVWSLVGHDIYEQNTPRMAAVTQVGQSLPPAVTEAGFPVGSPPMQGAQSDLTAGNTTVNNSAGSGTPMTWLVTAPGAYLFNYSDQYTNGGANSIQLFLNGRSLGTYTANSAWGSKGDSFIIPVQISEPGAYALRAADVSSSGSVHAPAFTLEKRSSHSK